MVQFTIQFIWYLNTVTYKINSKREVFKFMYDSIRKISFMLISCKQIVLKTDKGFKMKSLKL